MMNSMDFQCKELFEKLSSVDDHYRLQNFISSAIETLKKTQNEKNEQIILEFHKFNESVNGCDKGKLTAIRRFIDLQKAKRDIYESLLTPLVRLHQIMEQISTSGSSSANKQLISYLKPKEGCEFITYLAKCFIAKIWNNCNKQLELCSNGMISPYNFDEISNQLIESLEKSSHVIQFIQMESFFGLVKDELQTLEKFISTIDFFIPCWRERLYFGL